MEEDAEDLLDLIQIPSPGCGDERTFKCPHCGKDIVVYVRTLRGDEDTMEVWWGRNFNEIEEKQRRWEEEFGEGYEEEYGEEQ